MTLRPDPLLEEAGGAGAGFSVASTALVGPEGPRMSRARLGRRHLLGICSTPQRGNLSSVHSSQCPLPFLYDTTRTLKNGNAQVSLPTK